MARNRRRSRPYVNLRAGGNGMPPLVNYGAPGGPRITTLDAQGRPVRETVANGEFALPQVRGLRIRRGVRTNYGVRDLVVDPQGNVIQAIAAGANPTIRMSTAGPDGGRRLVVGRGSATTGGGAAPTTPGADTSGFTVDSGSYRMNPNRTELDRRYGAGQYAVVKVGNKWVVRRKPEAAGPAAPPDPYAAYNDYPWIKDYLSGMDRQYDSFQNYLTNTYNPQITAASQALTQARLNAGNVYNSAIQNYAGSAGTVASAMAPAQVAGATGGTIQAPNMNALGAAQSMAATANVGRSMDASARTALGGLEAEKIGQSFLSSAIGYGAGLLNQYGQKRQSERLKLDQWIAEQKAAAEEAKAKNDLELAKLDQSMINSLIVSGDRAAARAVTQRGQDLTNERAVADDTRQATLDQGLRPSDLVSGYRKVPKGAGRGWQSKPGAVQDINGDWWIPKPGGSGGGSGGGSTRSTPVGSEGLTKGFREGWKGKPGGTLPGGAPDPTNPGKAPTFGKNTPANKAKRIQAAVSFILTNRANFVRNGKFDVNILTTWLGSAVPEMTPENRRAIIDRVKKLI